MTNKHSVIKFKESIQFLRLMLINLSSLFPLWSEYMIENAPIIKSFTRPQVPYFIAIDINMYLSEFLFFIDYRLSDTRSILREKRNKINNVLNRKFWYSTERLGLYGDVSGFSPPLACSLNSWICVWGNKTVSYVTMLWIESGNMIHRNEWREV